MYIQYTILAIILSLSVLYMLRRVYRTLSSHDKGCSACSASHSCPSCPACSSHHRSQRFSACPHTTVPSVSPPVPLATVPDASASVPTTS